MMEKRLCGTTGKPFAESSAWWVTGEIASLFIALIPQALSYMLERDVTLSLFL